MMTGNRRRSGGIREIFSLYAHLKDQEPAFGSSHIFIPHLISIVCETPQQAKAADRGQFEGLFPSGTELSILLSQWEAHFRTGIDQDGFRNGLYAINNPPPYTNNDKFGRWVHSFPTDLLTRLSDYIRGSPYTRLLPQPKQEDKSR